jgi:raffinose/stachyose/melibiose transport system permease protein
VVRNRMANWSTYLYVLPVIVLSGVMLYYSIGYTIYLSFHDWNGLAQDKTFVGIDNYKSLFTDHVFYKALMNNFVFFVMTVGIQAVLGLVVAVLLKNMGRGKEFFKSLFFLPVIMAPSIISSIFRIILDANVGSLNTALHALHLGFMAQPWLGDPVFALGSVIGVNIFEWMGFSMMMYYAGLLAIPDEIYEAAMIDGSGFWNTLVRITVPNLNGTTSTLIVLGIVGSLKTFDIVYLLTNSGPGVSTVVLSTYLYKNAMEQFHLGMSSAIGVVVLFIALILSMIQLKLESRRNR